MKIHRFFVEDSELESNFWCQDAVLNRQWQKVLRFRVGEELALFNAQGIEKLYSVESIKNGETRLRIISNIESKKPKKNISLYFSLLKKDKNDWIIQKGTELGVSSFVPLISERCDRTDVSSVRIDRWHKIAVEAAEQCGRSDIPDIAAEPVSLKIAITKTPTSSVIFIAEQGTENKTEVPHNATIAIFIGPEGGWSDNEKALFDNNSSVRHLNLGDFTLRAETAAIVASAQFL